VTVFDKGIDDNGNEDIDIKELVGAYFVSFESFDFNLYDF
jgi:hypothetical protein